MCLFYFVEIIGVVQEVFCGCFDIVEFDVCVMIVDVFCLLIDLVDEGCVGIGSVQLWLYCYGIDVMFLVLFKCVEFVNVLGKEDQDCGIVFCFVY